MKSLKGTQTEKNLLLTFAGESQARNRYTFAASAAKKDGFEQISAIFSETAEQEKEHGKRMFKFLEGGELEIVGAFPAGCTKDTLYNLNMAADGENHEHTVLYPGFAKIALDEGFDELAQIWKDISVAEAFHEKRFRDFARNVKEGRVFTREVPVTWRCRNCGFVLENSKSAPELCPACAHPRAYFELLGINW